MRSKIKKAEERKKSDILMTLPSFINQLLLMMNSGATLTDAFKKISASYAEHKKHKENYFTEAVYSICAESSRTGESEIVGFYRFARKSNVKELNRVASIMMENRDRGTNLWQKLAEQSEALWMERKRMALEKIRLAESKMSFPLGILLLSLILITAAPAMMQI